MSPASIREQRLYYLEAFEVRERDAEGSVALNVARSFEFTKPIDEAALAEALRAVVAGNDALRTTLVEGPDGLTREVAAKVEVRLGALPEGDVEAAHAAACAPFDLQRGPLFRFDRRGERGLLVVMHRAIGDASALDAFEDALVAALAGETAEGPSVESLEEARRARVTDATRAHWRGDLAGAPVLDLPLEGARPEMAASVSRRHEARLDADLTGALARTAEAGGVSERTLVLAAFFTLLQRLTGQTDVVVAVLCPPAAMAIAPLETELPLRVGFGDPAPFLDLARRIAKREAEGREHAAMVFEEILAALELPRDTSRAPLCQAAFSWRDDRARAARGASSPISRREDIDLAGDPHDVALHVTRDGDRMVLGWDCAAALFTPAAAARFNERFEVLLRSILETPEASWSTLAVLPTDEREKLLATWNETRVALPDELYAHRLFEAQAARTPERVAVTGGGRSLTYGELDRGANQLAHQLRATGVEPGDLVGVFLERGVEMVATLHAVLRVGAAYVPIDPDYPADRIALMVQDSGLAAVVTRQTLAGALPEATRMVLLDEHGAEIAERPTTALPAPNGDGRERCYVIYTSGSTGRPKGVEVPHRAFLNFLESMRKWPGLSEDDVLVAVTTLSFDIAGLELFLPLSVGARVVIASREDATDGEALAALIRSSGATIMQATPSTWRLLLGAKLSIERPFKVLCGGEAFPLDLARELTSRFTDVFNMYGPTETTVWSTVKKLDAGEPVTIGRPIDNTRVYLLDREGQPTPIGVAGELVIGGEGVALGYLGREELTRERFLPDPFSKDVGARMYRTGDLASYREDGSIVYQRRLDHQVKVRGYRIELGEIESVLADHPNVASTVVIVREDRPGDARLSAYYVPSGDVPTVTDLRKHLKRRLPDYMIPQHFFELSALPLTPAGKVDRAALPVPLMSIAPKHERPPSSEAEVWLAKIWSDALRVDAVSASDHFFDVGGHSLLSMTVIAKVEKATGHRFRPRDLLHASLAELAQELEGKIPGGAKPTESAGAPRTSREERRPPTPSTPPPGFLTRLRSRFFGK